MVFALRFNSEVESTYNLYSSLEVELVKHLVKPLLVETFECSAEACNCHNSGAVPVEAELCGCKSSKCLSMLTNSFF